MNILIVDDERLVRVTLQLMLEELYGEENDIYQAGNAAEMEAMLQKMPFDLVFLDINMPKQQGLQAMEQIKDQYKGCAWCILTGYGYFEYAKKALELGAKGYLLKPPDSNELKDFMDHIKEERLQEHKKDRSFFIEAVRKGIYLDDFTDIRQTEGNFNLSVFWVDARNEERCRNIYQDLYQRLDQFINHITEEDTGFGLFFGTNGELCLLIKGEGQLRINSFLKLHFHEYSEEAMIVAFVAEFQGIQAVKTTLQLMTALSPLRFYQKNLDMVRVEDLNQDTDIMKKQYLGEQLEQLTSKYFAGDLEGFNHLVQKMLAEKDDSLPLTEEVIGRLSIIWGADFKAADIEGLLQEMKMFFTKDQLQLQSQNQIIPQICKYVEGNYMGDVSIEKMGSVMAITPTYLSRIFREKTGEKYIDYVTGVRMEKARELLEVGQYPVKQVSEMVGYTSEKYFSKAFKKAFGMSPSGYQK